MEKHTSIYALHDPRSWEIRYVGKANDPEKRLRAHMRRSKYAAMRKFVSELRSLGLELRVTVLSQCRESEWEHWEKFWIRTVRASGATLFNISKGGNAPATTRESCIAARLGKKDSSETRLRKSLAAKGKKKTPEHIANAAAAQRGRKFSEEHREKLRQAKLGTKRDLEFGIKHSSTMQEKWNDPNYRASVSAGLRKDWETRPREFSLEHRKNLSASQRERWRKVREGE